DIVDADWTIEKNIKEIQTLIDKIKFINNSSTIFLFTVPPVRGRLDRDNITIEKLNIAIKKNIFNCNIIDLSPDFSDEYNDLKSDYTYDGLHFTDKAYKKLKNIIEAVLK
ncbi:acylneuraminate cytidylyltransferase, partial [Escherichia coli]|nr:acylneuraminate cytidylyltransferase [Escherichia coli]